MASEPSLDAHKTPHIGCDYSGKVISLAVVEGSKVKAIANLQVGEDLRTSYQLLKDYFRNAYDEYSCCYEVIIEKPWMRQVSGVRGDTGLFTMRTATILELAVTECNMVPVFVYPQTWRKGVYGNGRPKDTKVAAIDFVQEEIGYTLPVMGKTGRGSKSDHNIAEAILLAYYGNKIHEIS